MWKGPVRDNGAAVRFGKVEREVEKADFIFLYLMNVSERLQ